MYIQFAPMVNKENIQSVETAGGKKERQQSKKVKHNKGFNRTL